MIGRTTLVRGFKKKTCPSLSALKTTFTGSEERCIGQTQKLDHAQIPENMDIFFVSTAAAAAPKLYIQSSSEFDSQR